MAIKPDDIYTTEEAREFLRISESTIKRYLKKGLIRANKIGGRYKILGAELLRLVSPTMEKETREFYRDLKKITKKRIKNW